MKNRALTLGIAAVAAVAIGCYKDKSTVFEVATVAPTPGKQPVNTTVNLKATMSGANENPANASAGTGTFTATLDTATNLLTYDITFSGLSAPVTLGHIHGPAAATANAGTTINFGTQAGGQFSVGATTGTAHGVALLVATTQITATINGDSLKKLLLAGLTYANIHTSQVPGGEIRGQILKQ